MARARTDRDPRGFGSATAILMLLAVLLAASALFVSGQAWSRSNDAESSVAAARGVRDGDRVRRLMTLAARRT